MALLVNLADTNGSIIRKAKISEIAEIGELLPVLIAVLGLPTTDDAGHPINYHISYQDRILSNDETLTTAGVQLNDTISLVVDIIINKTIEVFICYARENESMRQGLDKHLKALKRQGIIDIWHDGCISAGTEWESEVHRNLNSAQVILLLVSPSFIDSDYCYNIEMKRAIARHERGEVCVIPVILSSVYWQGTPFAKLQVLPKNAKPVTSWRNRNDAFFSVAEGIREAVEKLKM